MNVSFKIPIFLTTFLLHLATNRSLQRRDISANATLSDNDNFEISSANDGRRRKELRELSRTEIADMVAYFESLRKPRTNLNMSLLEEIDQESYSDEQFISRLEDALNLTLPYWDFELDRRLPNVLDSVLLRCDILKSDECFSDFNEETKSFGVYLDGMGEEQRSLRRSEVMKRNHFTYFLYVLLEVARFNSYGYSVDDCERCAPSNKWLFCDSTQMHCVSKVTVNGNCSSFENNSYVCYESVCINGTCSHTSTSAAFPTNTSSVIIAKDDHSSAFTNAHNEIIAREGDNSTSVVLSELISGNSEEFEFVSFAASANISDRLDKVASLSTPTALTESVTNEQQLYATQHSSADTAIPEHTNKLNSTSLSTSPPLILTQQQQSYDIQTNASQPSLESLEFQEELLNTSSQTALFHLKTTHFPSDQGLPVPNTPPHSATTAIDKSPTSGQLPIIDIVSSAPYSSSVPTTVSASSADILRSSSTVLISTAVLSNVTVPSSIVHTSSSTMTSATHIPFPSTTVQIPTALSSPTTTLSSEITPSSSKTLLALSIPGLGVVQPKDNETDLVTTNSSVILSQPSTETSTPTNPNIIHASTQQPTTTVTVPIAVVVDDIDELFANNQSLFTSDEKNITSDDEYNQHVPAAAYDLLQETLPYGTHHSSYSITTTISPAVTSSSTTLTSSQPHIEFDHSSEEIIESSSPNDIVKSSITLQTSSLSSSFSRNDHSTKTSPLHHQYISIHTTSTSTPATLTITTATPQPQKHVKKRPRPGGRQRNKKPGRRKNKTRHKFKDVEGDVHRPGGDHVSPSTTQIIQQFNDNIHDNSSLSRLPSSSSPYSQYPLKTSSQSQTNYIHSKSHPHTSAASPPYSHSVLHSSIHDQKQIDQEATTSSAFLVHFSITVIKGEPRRKTLLNRRVERCDITVTGLNMPNGYTQSSKGRLIAGTTIGLVHTLDPELHAPLVELRITVEDEQGRECVQRCLDSKGFYDSCDRESIRLTSHEFIAFADPIEIHQSEEDVLKNQWSGRGYYKKRKKDYLLFSCAKT